MEERTQIVIDIKLDEADVATRLAEVNKEMADIKQSNADIRKELREGTKTWSEVSEQLAENEAKMKQLKSTQAALSGQVAQATQKTRDYGTSLKEQAAKLNDLRNRYQSLDETQRNSRGGQKMLKEIKELDKAMKEADAEQGIFGRNVGDYANKMAEAFDKAGVSVKGLKGKFDLLNTNPILFFLGLLVGWLVKLKDRMKDNEKVTASLSKATTSLSPIMQGLGNVVGKLADIFSDVLNWAIEKTIQAIGWLGKALQKVGSWFGKDWGGGLTDMAAAMSELNNKTTEASETTETLADSTTSLKNAVKETRDALEDFLTTYKKVVEEAKKENLADVLQKAGGTKTAADVIHDMQKAYDDLDLTFKKLDTTVNDADFGSNNEPSFIERLAADFQNNAQTIEAVSSSLQSSFGSLSSIYKQMSEDETKSEAEREAAAKKAKQWSALQIAANSGTAIAKGVAASMDKPFPANLAALASTLAAVIAAIAQAKALAKGFETGGVIGGFQGATMGRDNTVASVRTGEMVLNANQQKTLFEIANGGATTSLTASLVAALQAMPAPVVEYTELQRFGNKVNILDNNAKLK